ncbi:MAG TPA: hypothetical protein V6D12_03345 [Candidatus Obscuribacterales bacterium]
MNKVSVSENVAQNNSRSLSRLDRAIALSQGQFSLILVCCNNVPLQEKIAKKLKEVSKVHIQELALHISVKTLLTSILTKLEEQHPQALMVFGLESVIAINQVLTSTNLARDEFRKQFPFPLVLWINDEILQKLIRTAPDFKSFATNTIRFDNANTELIEQKRLTA